MRVLFILILVLATASANPKKAAAFLLKDLKKFDPTVLPEDEQTEREVKAIPRDGNFEAKLKKVKKRVVKERIERWEQAAEELTAADDAATARALCDIFALATRRVDEADIARDECVKNWKACVKYHDKQANRNVLKKNQGPSYNRNQTNEAVWHQLAYGLLGVRIACARQLRVLESPDARRYLVETALVKSKLPELRAKIAEILTAAPDAAPEPVLAALKRERDPGVKAALLIAVSRLEKARPAGAVVAGYVSDPSERVRLAATRALERMHVVEGVEPLIAQLGKEEGLTQAAMARALESMTGKKFGTHPDSWRKWWDGQQSKLLGGGLPPRPEERGREPGAFEGKGHFYGIPQVSLKIIYIIDVSGSMKKVVDGKTRLEGCKTELSRAISQLPRLAQFNVVLYNHEVKVWKDRMVVAGPLKKGGKSNKEAAREFYKKALPVSSTNIYDALRRAFEVVGEGAKKRKRPLAADTIYMLTDGSPTTPDGKMDDTEKILEGVRKWNALGRVTIHTIGIGKDLNRTFLEQLARENNGRFIEK
ncbi:MAG: VWA domain-containing protein [Planctomycetota bacterium]